MLNPQQILSLSTIGLVVLSHPVLAADSLKTAPASLPLITQLNQHKMPEPEVSEAKVSEVKVSEVKAPELITIRTGSKIEQFQQQRVRLLGQYKASRQKPNPMTTGVIGFKGDYITARIFLQDGTEVGINSPMMKQSLRSEKEFQQYNEKVVEVVGRLERLEDSSENSKSSLYIVLETISLSLEK